MLFQKHQICFLTMPNSNSVEEKNPPKTEFLTQTFQDSRHGFADFSWVVQVGGGVVDSNHIHKGSRHPFNVQKIISINYYIPNQSLIKLKILPENLFSAGRCL